MADKNLPPIRTSEAILCAVVMVHGVVYLLPSPAFAFPNYAVMRSLAPENAWGAGFLLVGLLWVFGLVRNRVTLRRLGLSLAGVVFVGMAVSFILSVPTTVIGWTMLVLGVGAFVTRVQIR